MKEIIAFLDKEYPPSHSFVDGMLATELPKEKDIKVNLLVSGKHDDKICKYKRTICLPLLYPRTGIYRFLNFFKGLYLLKKVLHKKNKNEIILFVRNEPIYLLVCSVLKQKNMKLIFQSSFPHERVSGGFIKRNIATFLYKLVSNKVDSILAVSPKGLDRIKQILPEVSCGTYIPLLSDVVFFRDKFDLNNSEGMVKFIYIGDHSKPRKLDVVMNAIVKAYQCGLKAEFKFIGGKTHEIQELCSIDGVAELEKKGLLVFSEKIPREKIWDELTNADVGLSLIPPDEHYIEASPTKLTEYMGMGLAVLGSYGISLQEIFINESEGGVLCEWNEDDICSSFLNISSHIDGLISMKENSYMYAINHLSYKNYIDDFKQLM